MRRLGLLTALAVGMAGVADAGAARKRSRTVAAKQRTMTRAHVPAGLLQGRVVPLGWTTVAPPAGPAGTTPAPAPGPGPGTTTTPPPLPPPPLPRRSGVSLDEFSVVLTRNPLAAGTVELITTNHGMDEHDLAVRQGSATAPFATTPLLAPGEDASLTLELSPGTYTLFCSLYAGAHEQQGMKATLTVE